VQIYLEVCRIVSYESTWYTGHPTIMTYRSLPVRPGRSKNLEHRDCPKRTKVKSKFCRAFQSVINYYLLYKFNLIWRKTGKRPYSDFTQIFKSSFPSEQVDMIKYRAILRPAAVRVGHPCKRPVSMHRSLFGARVGAKEALGCCSRAQSRGVFHENAGQVANKYQYR
jgi:hypothetical protein